MLQDEPESGRTHPVRVSAEIQRWDLIDWLVKKGGAYNF